MYLAGVCLARRYRRKKSEIMKIELDKKGLIHLANGTYPHFDLFENELVKVCGTFNGSAGTWSWNDSELNKLSEEQLYNLYNLCIDSWKK